MEISLDNVQFMKESDVIKSSMKDFYYSKSKNLEHKLFLV